MIAEEGVLRETGGEPQAIAFWRQTISRLASGGLLVVALLATGLAGADSLRGPFDRALPVFAFAVLVLLGLHAFRHRIDVATRFTISLAVGMLMILASVLNVGFNTPNQYLCLMMLVVLSEVALRNSTTLAFQVASLGVVIAGATWFVVFQPPVPSTADAYDPKNWLRVLLNFATIVITTTMCLRYMSNRFRVAIIESEARATALQQETAARLKEAEHTRRLQARVAQTQRVEAMGRLASGVAHDFNNLLTVILASAESLQFTAKGARGGDPFGASPEDVDEMLDSILSAARRGSELTHDLLMFGRRYGEHPSQVLLDGVVSDACRLVGRLLPPSVRLDLELDSSEVWVSVCPGDIGQILMNLLVNARDAMPEGGTVRVTTATAPGVTPTVLLTVSDTGGGISAESMPNLFDPFFTTKNDGEGTGLGLSVVEAVVKRLGGTIAVDSQLGKGASFVIQLPMASPATARRQPTAAAAMAPLRT